MASTDYDFTLTRNEIIQMAYRKIGVLAEGESLTSNQLANGVDELNVMVKSWQAKHIYLWTLTTGTLSLVASTSSYSLGDDPPILSIQDAYLRDSSDSDDPLEIISWRDYQTLSDKTSTGDPTKIALFPKESPTLYVYPVPTSNAKSIYYLAVRKLKDYDSASGTGEFPVRWYNALIYSLAVQLAPNYSIPISERNDLRKEANALMFEAIGSDKDHDEFEFVRSSF